MTRYLVIIIASLLTACGQSGNLYLPDSTRAGTGNFLIYHDAIRTTHS